MIINDNIGVINIFLLPGARGRKSHPCGVLCGAPFVLSKPILNSLLRNPQLTLNIEVKIGHPLRVSTLDG